MKNEKVWIAIAVFAMCFWAAGIYVAYHFISKAW